MPAAAPSSPHVPRREPAPRTRRRAALRLAAGASAGLLALSACSDEEAPTVRTAEVVRGDVREVVDATGLVQPRASATVSAPAAGTVATLLVTDGQQVAAGDVLMTLDSPQARQGLQQARSADADAAGGGSSRPASTRDLETQQRRARADADARFADAQRQAEAVADPAAREASLAAVRSSRTQYDLLAAQTEALVAQVTSGLGNLDQAVDSLGAAQRVQTRAAVAAAQATVDALTVRAPVAGKVSLGSTGGSGGSALPAGAAGLLAQSGVQLPAGADAGAAGGDAAGAPVLAQGAAVASGARLATVVDSSELSLTADVDETDVLSVAPGTVADVTVEAVPGATYRGTVTGVDPTPATSGQDAVTYTVRLRYEGGTAEGGAPAPAPLAGMSTVVSLVVEDAQDVVQVPAAAVVRAGSQRGLRDADSVWVVEGGTAHRRQVSVGVRGDAAVEVVQGLRAGEQVVVEGTGDVTDGEQVS